MKGSTPSGLAPSPLLPLHHPGNPCSFHPKLVRYNSSFMCHAKVMTSTSRSSLNRMLASA
ncbi:hypothetical protein LINPERHAP1_LOCUS36987 [Linum perenne]